MNEKKRENNRVARFARSMVPHSHATIVSSSVHSLLFIFFFLHCTIHLSLCRIAYAFDVCFAHDHLRKINVPIFYLTTAASLPHSHSPRLSLFSYFFFHFHLVTEALDDSFSASCSIPHSINE